MEQQQQKNRSPKLFWIILICVLVAGFGYYLLSSSGKGTKISETLFIQQLEAEKVAKVLYNATVIIRAIHKTPRAINCFLVFLFPI